VIGRSNSASVGLPAKKIDEFPKTACLRKALENLFSWTNCPKEVFLNGAGFSSTSSNCWLNRLISAVRSWLIERVLTTSWSFQQADAVLETTNAFDLEIQGIKYVNGVSIKIRDEYSNPGSIVSYLSLSGRSLPSLNNLVGDSVAAQLASLLHNGHAEKRVGVR